MSSSSLFFVILCLALFSYWFGIQRAVKTAGGIGKIKSLVSLPRQFGLLSAYACGIPAIIALVLWSSIESTMIDSMIKDKFPPSVQQQKQTDLNLYLNDVKNLASVKTIESLQEQLELADSQPQTATQAAEIELNRVALQFKQLQQRVSWYKSLVIFLIAVSGSILLIRKFNINFPARRYSEKVVQWLLLSAAAIAIMTTVGIVFSVLFESIQFFNIVPIDEFIFGTQWSPQTALRADQVGSSGAFGVIPLFVGTLLITFIAMCFSVPVGLMIAIYLSQYASNRLRSYAKPMLEVLAGIPTVVYGFFAALTVAPLIRDAGESLGLSVASESALAAGIVMGIMIIPFVSSLSDDAINAVPKPLKEGSLAMGATQSETIKKVLLPAALPGIVGAILLAVSRAVGETMIVVMAAGMAANLTVNPLDSVTTVTVQIVGLLTGDQEFDSAKTLAAFALGLMLFITTLALNVIALKVVRRYRELYD